MGNRQTSPRAPEIEASDPAETPFILVEDSNWRDGKTFEDLLKYYHKKELCHDVEFVFGCGRTILFTKFTLRLRSQYFEELLTEETWSHIINVTDASPDNFRRMLKYLYTDELDVTYKNILDLRNMAKKYKISGMEQILSSEYLLNRELNPSNVVTLYQIAQVLEDNMHCDRALEFIVRNMSIVTHDSNFLNLTYDNLCGILERDDLEIEEISLLWSVLRWGCIDMAKTSRNIGQVLERALKLIRYSVIGNKKYLFRVKENIVFPNVTNKCRNNPMDLDIATIEIDCHNVVKYLKLAVSLDESDRVAEAFQFMQNNASTIFENDEYLELNLQHLITLLQSDELMVTNELEVFLGVRKWAIAECHRQRIDTTTKNMRIILGNALRQIRFGHINSQDFINYVVESYKGLLDQEETNDILLYLTCSSQAKAQKADSFIFPTKRRKGYRIYSVNLLPESNKAESNQDFSTTENFTLPYSNWFPNIKDDFDGNHFWRGFVVDQPISLISFGFYGPFEDNSELEIEFSLRELANEEVFTDAGKLIGQRKQIISGLTKRNIFHVEFYEPLRLKANIAYIAGFNIKNCSMCAHQTLDQQNQPDSHVIEVVLNSGAKVTFNFFSNNYSSVSILETEDEKYFYAQLPQINFVM